MSSYYILSVFEAIAMMLHSRWERFSLGEFLVGRQLNSAGRTCCQEIKPRRQMTGNTNCSGGYSSASRRTFLRWWRCPLHRVPSGSFMLSGFVSVYFVLLLYLPHLFSPCLNTLDIESFLFLTLRLKYKLKCT